MATSPPAVRRRVATLVDAGLSLQEIEEAVLDREPLSDEERAALWLYAWGRWRRQARRRPERRLAEVSVPEVPLG
jgi:hypothetical protein